MTEEKKKLGLFHKFIWFIWMPLSFIAASVRAYEVFSSNYAKYSPFFNEPRGGVLIAMLVLFNLMELCFVVAPVLVFIGFFKLRKYAWVILVLESASNIIFTPILMLYKNYDGPTILGKLLGAALDIAIVMYYWRKRELFGFGSKKTEQYAVVPEVSPSYMFCSECGCRVSSDFNYCDNCGAKL